MNALTEALQELGRLAETGEVGMELLHRLREEHDRVARLESDAPAEAWCAERCSRRDIGAHHHRCPAYTDILGTERDALSERLATAERERNEERCRWADGVKTLRTQLGVADAQVETLTKELETSRSNLRSIASERDHDRKLLTNEADSLRIQLEQAKGLLRIARSLTRNDADLDAIDAFFAATKEGGK